MSSKNKNYNYILIPILSFGLFTYSIWCGLGYTFDSTIYEEIALSFANEDLSGFYNPWLGNKPPLTSIVIFAVGIEYMLFFNLLCFLVVIGISYKLCINHLKDPFIKGIAILITTFGLPVYMANNFLWSEPLFNVCVILLFYLFQFPHFNWKQWLVIILLSNVMILMRHAGVFVLIGLFVSKFFFLRGGLKWWVYLLTFSLCCLGSIIWFLWASSSGVAWLKVIGSVSIIDKVAHNFYMLAFGFTSWFLPLAVPFIWRIIMVSLAFLLFSFLAKKHELLTKIDLLWIASSLIYIGFLHGVYQMPIEDGERYFSPIFGIIFLVLFKAMDKYIEKVNESKLRWAILLAVLVWSAYPTLRTLNNVNLWHTSRCEKVVKSSPGIFSKQDNP